jgi:hypothetical protein
MASLIPSGLAGFSTMASTPAWMRLRMSSSWPAASVLRCAMLRLSTMPLSSACAFIAQIISSRQPLPWTVLEMPIVYMSWAMAKLPSPESSAASAAPR